MKITTTIKGHPIQLGGIVFIVGHTAHQIGTVAVSYKRKTFQSVAIGYSGDGKWAIVSTVIVVGIYDLDDGIGIIRRP